MLKNFISILSLAHFMGGKKGEKDKNILSYIGHFQNIYFS